MLSIEESFEVSFCLGEIMLNILLSVPSIEERPSAPICRIEFWLAWKEKWSSSFAIGEPCEGLGEAMKNFGL